jgi:hypothetical protein
VTTTKVVAAPSHEKVDWSSLDWAMIHRQVRGGSPAPTAGTGIQVRAQAAINIK